MTHLLDTHALIWLLQDKRKLSKRVRSLLADRDKAIVVSAVSAWEIAYKLRLGKLAFDPDYLRDFDNHIRNDGFLSLPLLASHMVRGAEIDNPHKDPFDRMLAGQALVEDFTVMTVDPAIAALGAKVIW